MRLKVLALALLLTCGAAAQAQPHAAPTPEECRQFHADLAQERIADPAHALWTEGEARFDGHCLPKDAWHGLDLIERAVANGAEDAALTLRVFYGELGDTPNATKWMSLAALALYSEFQDRVREQIDGTPLPADVVAEWRAILETLSSGDAARIVARLDALAARPPILPRAESRFWFSAAYALRAFGTGESEYQFARGALTGRHGHYSPGSTEVRLFLASECHHPRAIVDHTQLFLLDRPLGAFPERIVQALARLHHLTGQYAVLLAEAERKLGRPAFRDADELIADLAVADRRCRALRR
jgi:hypothetical protein